MHISQAITYKKSMRTRKLCNRRGKGSEVRPRSSYKIRQTRPHSLNLSHYLLVTLQARTNPSHHARKTSPQNKESRLQERINKAKINKKHYNSRVNIVR